MRTIKKGFLVLPLIGTIIIFSFLACAMGKLLTLSALFVHAIEEKNERQKN